MSPESGPSEKWSLSPPVNSFPRSALQEKITQVSQPAPHASSLQQGSVTFLETAGRTRKENVNVLFFGTGRLKKRPSFMRLKSREKLGLCVNNHNPWLSACKRPLASASNFYPVYKVMFQRRACIFYNYGRWFSLLLKLPLSGAVPRRCASGGTVCRSHHWISCGGATCVLLRSSIWEQQREVLRNPGWVLIGLNFWEKLDSWEAQPSKQSSPPSVINPFLGRQQVTQM